MLTVLALSVAFTQAACYAEVVHRDASGRAYRHERWREEHVYQHEDGRWYAHRNGNWVYVEGVEIR